MEIKIEKDDKSLLQVSGYSMTEQKIITAIKNEGFECKEIK